MKQMVPGAPSQLWDAAILEDRHVGAGMKNSSEIYARSHPASRMDTCNFSKTKQRSKNHNPHPPHTETQDYL